MGIDKTDFEQSWKQAAEDQSDEAVITVGVATVSVAITKYVVSHHPSTTTQASTSCKVDSSHCFKQCVIPSSLADNRPGP